MKYGLFVVVFLFFSMSFVSAIGVTPPRIITDDILKGSVVEQSVRLLDIEDGTGISIDLLGEGSEWITVVGGNDFVFSEENDKVVFVLDIPRKAPNGDYTVRAQIVTSSDAEGSEGTNSASVVSGIMVDINFRVSGGENKKYVIRKIFIPNFEFGMPLTVTMDIENVGNVIARPGEVEIDVKEKISREIFFSDKTDAIGDVDPFQTGESIAVFDVDFEEDLYFGDVRVKTNEGIIEEKDIPFDVLSPGSLNSSGELVDLRVQDNVEDLAKITSVFENTGQHGVKATAHFEIYFDDALKGTVKTEAKYVREGFEQEFDYSYQTRKRGDYKVVSYVEFGSKKTNTKEIVFRANPSGESGGVVLIIVGIVVLLIILRLGHVGIKKRRRRRHGFQRRWGH